MRYLPTAAIVLLVSTTPSLGNGVIPDRATLETILGAGGITEDFETFDVPPGKSDALAIYTLDATTIVEGEGPGLVQPGATYISGTGVPGEKFGWQGDGYYGLPTKTLVAYMGPGGSMMMTIDYDPPVAAMGLDLFDYQGYSHTTTVSVFDADGLPIESVDLFIDGPRGVFFGYEAPTIGSVTMTGNPLGWSSVIDNHAYSAGGCLDVTDQEVVCSADGTTFTVNIEGLNACTGATMHLSLTGSGGAPGGQMCFTVIVDDGGFCCSTEICVTVPDCAPAPQASDVDGDGVVGIADFLALLAAWGPCADCGDCPADLDGDCAVGIQDLLTLLSEWG